MPLVTLTPRERKIVPWIFLVAGTLLTGGGLFGVWLQGWVYERGFPTPATFGEVRFVFTGPTAVTVLGSFLVSGVLLASSITASWSARRRLVVFAAFGVLVLALCVVCGHLATARVAKILN
jgi:hypothetical protein